MPEPLAVILSACRTPIGSFGGSLKDLTAVDLGAIVLREAVRRAGLPDRDVGDVVLGCVLSAGAGMNVARQAAVKAGLPIDLPAETVNRVCGSALQAVVHGVEAVRVGYTNTVVAGGTESMSNAAYALKGVRWGQRMGHGEAVDTMIHDGLTDAMHLCHMGMTAGSRRQVHRHTHGAGRVCRGKPAPCGRRHRERGVRRRDRRRPHSAEEGRAGRLRHRRIPKSGDDGREARGAAISYQLSAISALGSRLSAISALSWKPKADSRKQKAES